MFESEKEELSRELWDTLEMIDELIEVVKTNDKRIAPFHSTHTDGTFVMAPLLQSRAVTLAALVALKN